ncbi:GumC family protein [Aliiglaciecola sp. M165]|uniref:GumC family protein n=1 Tax=Aliiglaciecola sp. M165 TaxID=2593649 RepID=UPI00117CBB58|nr:polysaccharide biosynthesis tyrosine autokinase [Aliiglaciecola sp. M165]TRY32064.1 polysaccharide biosynthesis tyrosine autokinase [Aliiglaciecola sp. M165]
MSGFEASDSKQEVSFDVADLFAFLWQKKIPIVLTIVVLVSTGYYYVKKLPKMYMATSTLLLDDNSGNVSFTGLAALAGRSPSKMDTHIEFIRSKQFVRSVVESLDLHLEKEFFPLIGGSVGSPDIDHAVEVVVEDLTLNHLNETDMLKVSFVSKTPELAARVVNQIGPMFFAFQSEKSRERAEIASRWLNSQVEEIQGTLTQAETNLQAFLEENQLVDLNSQLALVQSEITTLMRERLFNEKIVTDLRSIVAQANRDIDDTGKLLGIPKIANNTVIIELRKRILEQQQLLGEISKRYKHKHYRFITATEQLQALQLELSDALQQSLVSLKREYQVVLQRQKMLTDKLNEAQSQHSNLGRLEIELTKLRRELESNQKLYEAFLSRLQETELLKDIEQQGNYSVIDYAAVPKRPFKPNVPLSLVVIGLLSSVLSVGFWLVMHLLSDKRSKIRQVLRAANLPVLAELPKPSKKHLKSKSENIFDERQQFYAFSEAIRSLRTALLVNKSEEENRIIAVTRISVKQNKSDLVIQLADSFSRMEKTLLIDADLRSPTIPKIFKLDPKRPGLTSLLSRQAKISECIFRPKNSPVQILLGGPIPADPLVFLSKQRFAGFVDKLSILNERVVIDLPPINAFSDAIVVSKLAHAVILECDVESITIEELKIGIQKLQEAGSPLQGVVLTNVKSKRKYK